MYIQVKLLQGYQVPLIYKIPKSWPKISNNLRDQIFVVPFRNKTVLAISEKSFFSLPPNTIFEIKEVIKIYNFPDQDNYKTFINYLSHYYQTPKNYLIKRFYNFILEEAKVKTSTQKPYKPAIQTILSEEQSNVYNKLKDLSSKTGIKHLPHVLHGVTSSGKTEIYTRLIKDNFDINKTCLFLLPEVSLAINFEKILKKKLNPNIPVFSFHSASLNSQKKLLWNSILEHKPILIIGVHLPPLLPIKNLGLIIIDEEHDAGFQEKKHPKINTKEAALFVQIF